MLVYLFCIFYITQSHVSYSPRDPSFDVQLGTQLELHRIVEYCQWHEVISFMQFLVQVKPVNQTEGKVEYYKDWSDEMYDNRMKMNENQN